MKLRIPLGILAGLLIWWVMFYASGTVFMYFWPAMLEAAGPVVENNDFSQFTTPMLLLLIVMYLWVNPIAGWLIVYITKNRDHVWIASVLMLIYAGYIHWFQLWNNLPDWYNVLVPIMIPPLMYLGGRLVKLKAQ